VGGIRHKRLSIGPSGIGGMYQWVALCFCVVCLSSLCGMLATITGIECVHAEAPDVSYVVSVSVDNSGTSFALPRSQRGESGSWSLAQGPVTCCEIGPWETGVLEAQCLRLRDQVVRSTVVSRFALSISMLALVCSLWSLWILRRLSRVLGVGRGLVNHLTGNFTRRGR